MKCVAIALMMLATQMLAFGQNQSSQSGSATVEPDEWVATHLDEIHQMTRADWLKLDYPLSKPVFVAFTPTQKEAFWRDKIQEVLALEWSDAERAHIKECLAWMETHREMFSGSNKAILQESEDFFLEWAAEGIEKFRWSKHLPAAIAVAGNRMTNKNGDLIPLKGETCRLR